MPKVYNPESFVSPCIDTWEMGYHLGDSWTDNGCNWTSHALLINNGSNWTLLALSIDVRGKG
jgi:hypothetical protein